MIPVFLAAVCVPAVVWFTVELRRARRKAYQRHQRNLEHRSPAPVGAVERRTVAGATPRTVSSRLPVSGWGWE